MPKEIDIIPFANNSLTSDFLFTQREYYVSSSDVYPQEEGLPKPVDIWYERPLWGKVDTKQRLIFPDQANLKPINDELVAINFVADAYADFRDFATDARFKLNSSMTSFIDIENPKKAYDNSVEGYRLYFENVLDPGFVNTFLTDLDKSQIKNFLDYSREYLFYVDVNSQIPHTLAGYVCSTLVSYRNNGLIIEFADDAYDDDSTKWVDYLSNDFFDDYIRIAASFGFYVNKHIPWAIVANLNSKQMKKYMQAYDISNDIENFNLNYLQAEYMSYVSFKKYMFLSYASFITSSPRIEVIKYKNCIKKSLLDSSFKTEREVQLRPVEFISVFNPTYQEFINAYPESFFIDLYINIRLREEKIKLTQKVYKILINDVAKRIESVDLFEGMLYLSNFLAFERKKLYSILTDQKLSANILQNNKPASSYFYGVGGSSTSGY